MKSKKGIRSKILIIFILIAIISMFSYNVLGMTNGTAKYEIQNTDVQKSIASTIGTVLMRPFGDIMFVLGMAFEGLIGGIWTTASGSGKFPTIDQIVYNQVPYLDANIFNPSTDGTAIGQAIDAIAGFYIIVRYLALAFFLGVLIILGIKLLISTIAEDKAKYKEMIMSWLVGLVLLFFMHYIMSLMFAINEFMCEKISAAFTNSISYTVLYKVPNNIVDALLTSLFSIPAGTDAEVTYTGIGGIKDIFKLIYFMKHDLAAVIMYLIFLGQSIIFLIFYVKRIFNIIILTILFPFVALFYAVEGVTKGSKSSILDKWIKEYGVNIFIQTIHAIFVTLIVTLSLTLMFRSY